MNELKLRPLPKHESVRCSITIPKPLMDALELYTADFCAAYHDKTDVPALVPAMLEAFLRSDKAFLKRHADSIREQAARAMPPLPTAALRSPPSA
jgi:hypothetical protein